MKALRVLSLLPFLAAGLAAPHASATTIVKRSLADMVGLSELVLEVRVTAKESVRPETVGGLWTRYDLEVVDVLAGGGLERGQVVSILQVGGTEGDRRVVAVGIPHYEVGDRVVVFLRDYGAGLPSVVNAAQGSLKVRVRDGVDVVPSATTYFPEARTDELGLFKQAVRAALAGKN